MKDWTVLIYANGNNELLPEIWNSKIQAEKIGSSGSVNVVMEIGIDSLFIAKSMRPYQSLHLEIPWNGVRRYYVEENNSVLIDDLGKINMADHNVLYQFITWGINKYPAKKYMLIISGHGSSFVGVLPDLSQRSPYIMGVWEMCHVINKVKANTNAHIDILALDMCYMNYIEILYELGKDSDPTVKNLITYISNGPLQGMPYDKIITILEENIHEKDTKNILKILVDNINENLVATEINHGKLKRIKNLSSSIAYLILCKDNKYSREEALAYINKINLKIASLIVKFKTLYLSDNKPIDIISPLSSDGPLPELLLDYYDKFSFANNNYWTSLLKDKSLSDSLILPTPKPTLYILPKDSFRCLIYAVNNGLDEEEVDYIIDELYNLKKWVL